MSGGTLSQKGEVLGEGKGVWERRSWVESHGKLYISAGLHCLGGDHYYGAILAAHISEHALRDSGSLALLEIGHFFLF